MRCARRYIYIEMPFWYERCVSIKVIIIYCIVGLLVCHLIGLGPLMRLETAPDQLLAVWNFAMVAAIFLVIGK